MHLESGAGKQTAAEKTPETGSGKVRQGKQPKDQAAKKEKRTCTQIREQKRERGRTTSTRYREQILKDGLIAGDCESCF